MGTQHQHLTNTSQSLSTLFLTSLPFCKFFSFGPPFKFVFACAVCDDPLFGFRLALFVGSCLPCTHRALFWLLVLGEAPSTNNTPMPRQIFHLSDYGAQARHTQQRIQ